jgi:hypothetical protein
MSERLLRRLPSPLALFLISLTAVALALAFVKGLQDPDFFWHYMDGRYLVTTGSVPSADPFSFTYPGGHRTPHEWLSELLIYALVAGPGPNVALAVFALALPIGFAALALALRARGLPALAISLPLVLAAAVAIPYATVRPQVLSWMLLAVELALLLTLRPERLMRTLWLIPLFAVWANVHGLYAVGLAVLGWYLLFSLLGRTPMAGARRWILAAAIGAGLASMLTPEGPAGILYPLRFLNAGDWGLANIPEWRSPNFHDVVQLPLLALIVAVALSGGRGSHGWLRGLAYIGIAMALIANRNAPVAAILAVPTLALAPERWLAARATGPVSPADATRRRLLEVAVAVVVVIGALSTLPANARGVVLDRYPVAAVDRLATMDPGARVLAEYGWGGYVIYRLYDQGGRVFVDGRNDLYPQAVLDDYSAARNADPGWEEIMQRYGVEAILFRPDATLVKGPAQAAGWCETYRDAEQVLLRPCGAG